MKKEELIRKIELGKKIDHLEKLSSLVEYKRSYNDDGLNSFPSISPKADELLKRLRDKCKSSKDEVTELLDAAKCNCGHEVRLFYRDVFSSSSTCIFCGERINGDNLSNGNTIYNSKNRNKNCFMVPGSYEDDDDGYVKLFSKSDLFKHLETIVYSNEAEDIDVIDELAKLNLKDAKVNKEEPIEERYVLIIGGTNQMDLGQGYKVVGPKNDIGLKYAEYFSGIYNTYVEYLDNLMVLRSRVHDDYKYYCPVENIDELMEQLRREKNVPFNLIIDLNDMKRISFKDDQIVLEDIDLGLEELFPGVEIVRPSKEKMESKENVKIKAKLFK